MEKNWVSSLTAQNATETTKTLIDTITVPIGAKKLVEVGVQIIAKGFTTLESVSCILELESEDMPWNAQAFVSDATEALTSGAGVVPSKVHDCDIDVTPLGTIKCYTTFNMVLTITPSLRVFGKFRG